MSAAAALDHLPEEREDPRAGMLDLIEHAVQTGLDAGLAPQIVTRLLRMLPDDIEPCRAVPEPAPESQATVAPRAAFADIERVLRLSNVRHFGAASRAAGRDVHLETIDAEIERLKTTGGLA